MAFNVQKQERYFDVSFDPQQPASSFHFIWLRDNCTCVKCFFPSSQQKVHSCATIPANVHPREFNVDNNSSTGASSSFSVVWNDGHESTYTREWLQKHAYTNNTLQERRLALKPSLWRPHEINNKHSVDYTSFMQDDAALMKILKTFLDYGIMFITGVPGPNPADSVPPIEKVITRIGPLRETFYGRMFDVINYASEASNLAFSAHKLELHQDMVYYESVPPVQLLHCIVQSNSGGENVFVDSYHAAEQLKDKSPHHFDTLLRVPVTFQRMNAGHSFSCQKPILYQNENLYIGVNYSPHNHGALRAPPSEVEAWYTAFSEFSKTIYSEELMLTKKLAPGELVMFDNRRVLHGRASYSPGEARHLQGAYLGMDEVQDRFNVLKWQSEKLHK